MITHHYRVTKYDPQFRDSIDSYLRDEWTGPHQVGEAIDGHVLTEDEFEETVNKYLYAVEAFAQESGVTRLRVVGLDEGLRADGPWQTVQDGSSVSLDRALDLVRSMLRDTAVGAPLEDEGRFSVYVGDRMYMWIGSHVDCVHATEEAQRIGLFVEPDQPSPVLVPPEERFWWLREGQPVKHILVSEDAETGATVDRRPYPDDKVPRLRELFPPNPGDEDFYELYRVDEARRARVAEILGVSLDPARAHSLWTET